ncbi:MAG: hypothetical protein ACRD0P_16810, partial [Stackebrandtia sp.]
MSSGCGHDASELTVRVCCDPPLRHATVAAFTARALAVQLERLLAARFSTCSRLTVTATGREERILTREWRHDKPFTVDAVSELVREQLVEWLATDVELHAVSLEPGTVTP